MTGTAPAPPGDAEVLAACAFAAVPGIGASTLSRIVAVHGSLELALAAGPAALLSRAAELRLRAATIQYLEEEPDLVRLGTWALEEAHRAGARPVLLGREGYPALLARAPNPPALLYVRGKLVAEAKRVAIVGSRDSDDLGLRIARALAEGLARASVEVVSGGARGVDAAAHAGALWGEGSTVAVLGCGIDQAYPAENRDLFDRIAAGSGAVLSELVPGSPPARSNFPRRNRIIAGLSDATVVVRAGSRSGALVTARDAFAAGRKVFAVRGPAADALSEGTELLLREGVAREIAGASDLCTQLGWQAPSSPHPPVHPYPTPAHPEPVQADELGKRLLALLTGHTPVHVDELAARSHLPPQEALRKLTELEILGLCRQRPGKYFERC
ncbi:MAG: DNA-processing protein DprA [Myxococcales bacterium]